MAILVTSKYGEDPIKIEGARVATIQNTVLIFQTLKGSSLCSQRSDLAEILTHPGYCSYPCYLQELRRSTEKQRCQSGHNTKY